MKNIVPILYKYCANITFRNLIQILGKYRKIFDHINFHGLCTDPEEDPELLGNLSRDGEGVARPNFDQEDSKDNGTYAFTG